MVTTQEKSSLLQEQKNDRGHFNVALSQQRHRPNKLWTLHRLIYICGLCILFSKIKSRCTPPKSFQLEDYQDKQQEEETLQIALSSIKKEIESNQRIYHTNVELLSTFVEFFEIVESRDNNNEITIQKDKYDQLRAK